MCSDCLNDILYNFYSLDLHKPVIDIIIPHIAAMRPLAEEAVRTNDIGMCKQIILIYIELSRNYYSAIQEMNNIDLIMQLIDVDSLIFCFIT